MTLFLTCFPLASRTIFNNIIITLQTSYVSICTLSAFYLTVVSVIITQAAQDWLLSFVLNVEEHHFSMSRFKNRRSSRAAASPRGIISYLSCHGAPASVHPVLSKHLGLFSGWCLQIWPLVLLPCSRERNARSAQDGETEEWMTSYPITCHLYTGPASGLEETTWDKQLHGKRFWSPQR